MTAPAFDRAAYMRGYRRRKRAEGKCPNCGLPAPPADTTSKCRECRAVDKAKEKVNRRFMRLGKAVEPMLKEAMSRGEYTRISPSQAKALMDILDQPRAT